MRRFAVALPATLATLAFAAAPAYALTATTGSPVKITDTSATMRGQVDPGVLSVAPSFYFEYGRTAAYGSKTPAISFSLPTIVKVTLLGLPSSTTVHYRIVATGLLSTARGADKSFTTLDPPAPPSDTSSGSGTSDNSGTDSNSSGPGSGSTPPSSGSGGTGSTPPPTGTGSGSTPPPSGDGSTATDSSSQTSGGDDPAPEQLPAVVEAVDSGKPVLGSTIGAAPQSGSIEVKAPGSSDFTPLPDGASIPVGSTVDASNGAVNVVTAVGDKGAVQTATFRGAVFQVKQSPKAGGLTDIYLRGGDFSVCRTQRSAPANTHLLAKKKRRRAIRRLWGHDRGGRFRTHGRGAIATVRGTTWIVADHCDGTRTSVLSGAVSVRDKRRHKTVLVHAGHSYFARTHR